MAKKRTGWTYEGPINLDNRRHSIDFRGYTIAGSYEEAERNIIWQYKIRFGLKKNADVKLDGLLYRVSNLPNIAEPKEKQKNKYDYEQLEMDI